MYFRIGNVVKANKDFSSDSIDIHPGMRGRIVFVAHEVSVDILFDGHASSTLILKRDYAYFDLQVVTHEVHLIDNMGRMSGKFLCCIILKDHEDGFFDILCQDGREALFVHTSFLRELPSAVYSDVGYSSTMSPSGSRLDGADNGAVAAEVQTVVSTNSPSVCHSLPPEGYQGSVSSLFNPTSPLVGARSRNHMSSTASAPKRQEEETPTSHVHAPNNVDNQDGVAPQFGAQICPFMEIQDGGLRALMGLMSFTSNDTVVDIGCGHGKILNMVLQHFPCQGIGVEVNRPIARVAEYQLRKYGKRASVVIDDVRNVNLQKATATVSFMLSHSFDAQGKALKEHMSKSLPPGCIVFNYCYPVLGWRGSHQNGVWKYVIGEHLPNA
jgi:hypothetical protein